MAESLASSSSTSSRRLVLAAVAAVIGVTSATAAVAIYAKKKRKKKDSSSSSMSNGVAADREASTAAAAPGKSKEVLVADSDSVDDAGFPASPPPCELAAEAAETTTSAHNASWTDMVEAEERTQKVQHVHNDRVITTPTSNSLVIQTYM